MDFATILSSFNLAAQSLNAALPAVQEYGNGDHVNGATDLIKVAGATAAAATKDSVIQAEAVAATELAISFVPPISAFVSLFHKKAKAVTEKMLSDLSKAAASTTPAMPDSGVNPIVAQGQAQATS